MKKARFCIFFVVFMVILPYFAPAQELDDVIAGAREARRLAAAYEGNLYFPGEWEAADEQLAQAEQLDDFIAATASFEAIFRLTIPLYAQAREDEIMELRNYLVAQGMRSDFPEYLSPADITAVEALELFEAGEYESAENTAATALQMYQALFFAVDAWQKWQEISEMNFEYYDYDNFERAMELMDTAEEAYIAGDYPQALQDAEEAFLRYSLVLSTGWAGYAELRSSLAEGEREAALSTDVNIIAEDYFALADSDYQAGWEYLEAQQYVEAASAFSSAETQFAAASAAALERRLARTTGTVGTAEIAGTAQATPTPVHSTEMAPAAPADRAVLPATFTVRSWATHRDCFWTIANLVYGDPYQWRVLYNANRSKLPNPDNPDLIETGMVMDIPSLRGEVRQGAWRE